MKQAGGIKVFIRYDVHAARAGIKLKGQPPLTTPVFIGRLHIVVLCNYIFDIIMSWIDIHDYTLKCILRW